MSVAPVFGPRPHGLKVVDKRERLVRADAIPVPGCFEHSKETFLRVIPFGMDYETGRRKVYGISTISGGTTAFAPDTMVEQVESELHIFPRSTGG